MTLNFKVKVQSSRFKVIQGQISELVQRMFKYGDIPDNSLTPNKELNILIY